MESRDQTPNVVDISQWNATHIPDLTGKVAVVTGGNSGLGFIVCQQLAAHGCEVIMACRNLEKGEAAKSSLLMSVPEAKINVQKLDMASNYSIMQFVQFMNIKYGKLSLLINNAGALDLPFEKTVDGFDVTFQTNYLSQFFLTASLYSLLENSPGSRIVCVGSTHHASGEINFKDLQGEKKAGTRALYYNSKLMLLNFAMELDLRLRAKQHSVVSVAAHPGFTATNILTSSTGKKTNAIKLKFFQACNNWVGQSPLQGALPILYAATAPDVVGGEYFGPDGFLEMRGNVKRVRGIDRVYDRDVAKKLWELSENYLQSSFVIRDDPSLRLASFGL